MATLSGVTTYTHDLAGNRTQVDRPDSTSDTYTWDSKGQMTLATVAGSSVTITYNAAGQRVAKETPAGATKYRYDHKNLIQETDGSDALTKSYTLTDEEYGDLISEHDFINDGAGTGEFYSEFGWHSPCLDIAVANLDTWRESARKMNLEVRMIDDINELP